MKQRVRKLLEYTWADRLGYAVAGTPNLLEYDQGFFVKGGDGLADLKPIARLYKGQVYALARELGLPESVATRYPTTDTFSLPQTQEEFYFGHPYDRMDLLLWGHEHGVEPAELHRASAWRPEEVEAAYREIERRRVATEYLHAPADPRGARGLSRCVRHRGHRAARSGGPPVDERRAAADGAGDPPSRARTASGSRSSAGAGFVSTRLAIFDIPGGWQPLEAAAGGDLLVYNGEVYNHPELRAELEARGESFATTCDTEVVLRLLERDGPEALERFNGQFAFAWWQPRRAPPDAGSRPLRRAAASLRAAGRRHARLRLGGQGALRLGGGCAPSPTSTASTRCSRSGGRGRREPRSPAISQLRPGGLLVWERGASSRSAAWWRPAYGQADGGRRRPV